MSAIILDGHLKSALAAVRSLGARGISVTVGSVGGHGMSAYSRYTERRFIYPSPLQDTEGFISALEEAVKLLKEKPVVYSFSDATYLALYAHRERVENIAIVAFPDDASVRTAFDKFATFQRATELGIPAIETHSPSTDIECKELSLRLRYPAVIKPRHSVSWRAHGGSFGTAKFVFSPDELVSEYRALFEMSGGEAPLIQQRIVGEEYGVEMIAHEGVPLGLIAHRRIRSMSPTGGAATVKETLEEGSLRDSLMKGVLALAKDLRWEGPMMVEFKVDEESGVPYLMEINGRFWGSLPLSVAAGVDMPFIYYNLALGKGNDTACEIPVRYALTRHFLGDARWLLRVLVSNDPMRSYAYPSRIGALITFLTPARGTRGDVWSLRDPLPAFMECIILIRRLWK